MALGDGIRRNIAHVSQTERTRFKNAIVQLNNLNYPDGTSKWVKQDKIHEATHIHGKESFLPWHRELCNRFEQLLREVDSDLSLHYWDWTEDPRAASDGNGGTINLFTTGFMGEANGVVGAPFAGFPPISRNIAGGASAPSSPSVDSDSNIINSTNGVPQSQQFNVIRNKIEDSPNHNSIHGYIGGTIGNGHTAFEDPFVFLLHSNVDRLWAMWQCVQGQGWRLNPSTVYGNESSDILITENLEPWAGGPPGLRPWTAPDNQQVLKNSLHISVVTPPKYGTLPSKTSHNSTTVKGLHLCGTNTVGRFWHTIRRSNGSWYPFGDVEGQTGDRGSFNSVACADIGNDLHVCGSNTVGRLWHAIRRVNGSWTPFGDIEGQTGDRGSFNSVACAAMGNELHVSGTNTAGRLWHAIRRANGSWTSFGDIESQTGDRGSFNSVACAAIGNELHVSGTNTAGRLWHAIRRANGSWTPFGDIEGQTGDRGSFNSVACAAVGNELHVCGTTTNGHLWHAIRRANGPWTPFGDVESQTGDRGSFNSVACTELNGELHVSGTNTTGKLWHAIRRTNGSWTRFGDVEGQTGDRGSFNKVACTGIA